MVKQKKEIQDVVTSPTILPTLKKCLSEKEEEKQEIIDESTELSESEV